MTKEIVNDSSYWREFEKNDITHSAAHYLMAIDSLRSEHGYARVTDVADMLEISRGAASMSISHLKKRDWVTADPNGFLLLTEEGMRMANLVEHNFQILSKFFKEILGVSTDTALADSCKMEHLMSVETARKLVWFMRGLLEDEDIRAAVATRMKNFRPTCKNKDDCPLCQGDCLIGYTDSEKEPQPTQ